MKHVATLARVVVDGAEYKHISAVGIGHDRKDLVLVQQQDDGKSDAIVLGSTWQTLLIEKEGS